MSERPLSLRFEEKYIPEPNSGCWLWTGNIDKHGYGRLWVAGGNGKTEFATHVALRLDDRSVTPGLCALHKCDVPACVNPAHLFLGTKADNTRDMVQKGRARGNPNPRGERNGHSKLTASAVLEIRQLRASGWKLRQIAQRFAVSREAVSGITTGRTWAHV